MRVFATFDEERDAWVVMVNGIAAIMFEGEDAMERAAASARDIREQLANLYPWLSPRDDDAA